MVGLDFKLPPEEQITAAAAGQTRIKWDERIAGHITDADNKVKELIYDGIVQGQSYSDVARGIKERFDITATKAETIARTESHRAREMGNMAATIEAAEMGINMMRRWLATLDGRTRDTHGAMDGQEIEVYDDNGEFAFFESPEGGSALYPGGFGIASEDINCRCSTIDIVKGYEPTTRRARDEFGKGEVIPYTNFTQYAQSKGWATPYAGVEPRVVVEAVAQFVPAQSLKEVEQRMVDSLGVEKANLKGFELDAANNYLKTIEDVINKHPEIRGMVNQVKTGTAKNMTAQYLPYLDKDGVFKGNLTLYRNHLGDMNTANSIYADSVKRGFHMVGYSPAHVPAHELGHVMETLIGAKKHGVVINTKPSIKAWNAMSRDFNSNVVAREITEGAFEKIGVVADSWDAYNIKKIYGDSALISPAELMAHAVADALVSNNPHDYSNAVMAIIRGRM